MAVDKRVFSVLDAIVNEPGITSVRLEEKFQLTRKQLSYTLKKINDFLEANHFKAISRFKTGRFFVDNNVIDYFRRQDELNFNRRYLFSESERSSLIIFLLLTRSERLSLLHLSSGLNVSQNTIINDFKKIKQVITENELSVQYDREHGYRISGEEMSKRHLLLSILRDILKMPVAKNILSQYNDVMREYLESVGDVFNEIEKKLKIQFVDQSLQELIYFCCFVLHRIASGKVLQQLPDHYLNIAQSYDFDLIKSLLNRLIVNQEYECIFFTVLIQSANIQSVADKYSHLDTVLLNNVVKVVNNFEKISCVTIKDKDLLIEKIYQHWKPAYYRIRYHFNNNSSVYDLVTEEFSYLHEMVRRSITPFEKHLHCELPEDEVAFLTVIFGGFLIHEGTINDIQVQKTAIVVCENSATVSAYIYKTLHILFPEIYFAELMSRREFEKYTRHYDIIFSTTHLKTEKILFIIDPVSKSFHKETFRYQVINALQGVASHTIKIDQLLGIFEKFGTILDRKALERELASYIYDEKYSYLYASAITPENPSLHQLLTIENICLLPHSQIDWQAAIELAGKPLIQSGAIEKRYISCIINRIKIDQPYILLADNLIIAHAGVNDGVKHIGVSLLRLPESIDIAGYLQADIIIVLATHDQQKHLKALTQLNTLLEFYQGAEKIRQAMNELEIIKLIERYG